LRSASSARLRAIVITQPLALPLLASNLGACRQTCQKVSCATSSANWACRVIAIYHGSDTSLQAGIVCVKTVWGVQVFIQFSGLVFILVVFIQGVDHPFPAIRKK
jgi:hypothetical protein